MDPLVWIKLPADDPKPVLTTALERGFTTFVPADGDLQDLEGLGTFTSLRVRDDEILDGDEPIGRRVHVTRGKDQERAMQLVGAVDHLVLRADDWTVIPIENLIAEAQATSTTLLAEVDDAATARVVLGTLEVGTDGLVLDATSPDDVLELARVLDDLDDAQEDLQVATVRSVEPVGSGDRVCVDTANLLDPDEGLLVGSTNACLFLVLGETLENEYVAPRPFRVNAGPVHAYTLGPDGRTRYLSELRAGDDVLVAGADGRLRTAVLGRVKIEHRPLLLVRAEVGDREVTTLLQNAETVRLATPDGAASVVDLEPGDEVLVRPEQGGRHFGRAVDETVEEV